MNCEVAVQGFIFYTTSITLCLHVCPQVPAALLTFAWDAAVQADIAAAGGKSPTLLKPELLETIRTLSWGSLAVSKLPSATVPPFSGTDWVKLPLKED